MHYVIADDRILCNLATAYTPERLQEIANSYEYEGGESCMFT